LLADGSPTAERRVLTASKRFFHRFGAEKKLRQKNLALFKPGADNVEGRRQIFVDELQGRRRL
jgi:hypothetical protein